jgi:glycolate oxidase iron-sulfur subunit
VIFIEDIGCCGAPIEASGDLKTFEQIRDGNVKMFNSVRADGIVTTCGTCGLQLKESYYNKGLIDKPICDISQVVLKHGLPLKLKPLDFNITYHDPCHLSRGLGITREPRDIITSIPGVSFIEMFEADSCCGCAGFFTATHYPIASAIRKRKIDNVQNSGANVVVSGCPGCMMHISEGIKQRDLKKTTLHLVELVDMSLSGNGQLVIEIEKQARLGEGIKLN